MRLKDYETLPDWNLEGRNLVTGFKMGREQERKFKDNHKHQRKINLDYLIDQIMYDLLSYKDARIEALLNEINRLRQREEQLTTYIFELCDKECPDDYREVIKSAVYSE